MSVKELNPYLNFDGDAAQAIKLYERALGAQVQDLMRFGDVKEMHLPPEQKDRVMHAMLRIGQGVIMISDIMPGTPFTPGGSVHVCLHFDDAAEMTQRFDALAAGGKVTMPLADTFWDAKFGIVTDAFGVSWMFNAQKKTT